MSALERLSVFCGSTAGEDPRYLDAATEMGRFLAEEELGLVYGGGRVGLMGRLADAALEQGGEVIGVIPRAMVRREIAHEGLTELRTVVSMHQRKALMEELSDGFIALPGGLGTIEEFFEILTWAQLGLHRKPCGILDVEGFFQPLVALLDHLVVKGFISESTRAMCLVETSPRALLERMRTYDPPALPRWIDGRET